MGCIYSLFCVPTQKEYIGKTTRKFAQRLVQHRCKSKDSSLPIYNAARKYGWDSFIMAEVFQSDDESILFQKEQEYIAKRNTIFPFGYNMTEGGEGTKGTAHSEKWRIGNKRRAQDMGKSVYCLETDTVYPSIMDAAKAHKAVSTTISGICNRPDHKSKGYHYCYDTKIEREHLHALANSGELYELPITWRCGEKNTSARKVLCVELNKVFPTMKEAVSFIKKPPSAFTSIVHCCRGKYKTAYGYHWRYADDM